MSHIFFGNYHVVRYPFDLFFHLRPHLDNILLIATFIFCGVLFVYGMRKDILL